jgi:hypothetical protein
MLQSLELRARPNVESSLPADALQSPLAGSKPASRLAARGRKRGPFWLAGSWNANALQSDCTGDTGARDMERERARLLIVISSESSSGPGLHGKPGFVASWRPINLNRTAIRVGGSPFKTFAEAENACEAMLAHLIK